MHRFFVRPEQISPGRVRFTPEQSRQIATVLRMQPPERLAVLDNAGWIYDVQLEEVHPAASLGAIRSRRLAPGEPRTKVTLYPALLKSDKLEFVLQKCTELGVAAFEPTVTARSNVGAHVSEAKAGRWERIIAEAAEQSERGRLPQLRPVTLFPQATEQARGLSFIAWERGGSPSPREALTKRLAGGSQRPFSINLFVGSEGGFTPEEVALAQGYGIIPISLGPRILRAETASIVGVTLILAYAGDLE